MGGNSLPKTVTRQRRDCDLNPGLSAPESSTLAARLPNKDYRYCCRSDDGGVECAAVRRSTSRSAGPPRRSDLVSREPVHALQAADRGRVLRVLREGNRRRRSSCFSSILPVCAFVPVSCGYHCVYYFSTLVLHSVLVPSVR